MAAQLLQQSVHLASAHCRGAGCLESTGSTEWIGWRRRLLTRCGTMAFVQCNTPLSLTEIPQ